MSRGRYEPCPKCRENGRDSRGDNLYVYPDGSAHCFANCGYHRFPTHYVRVDHKQEKEANGSKVLPADFTREVPAKGWQWLLQYGLPFSYWQPFTGYSERDDRLILTVPDTASVAFSIGRDLSEAGTTGTPGRRKWHSYGDCHKDAHLFGATDEAKEVVLVEDLCSAHKVGQVSAVIPLFGTTVFDGAVRLLRYLHLPVVMWLDADQRGTVAKKAANLSLLINQPVRYIFTEKDPKSIPVNDIKEILN